MQGLILKNLAGNICMEMFFDFHEWSCYSVPLLELAHRLLAWQSNGNRVLVALILRESFLLFCYVACGLQLFYFFFWLVQLFFLAIFVFFLAMVGLFYPYNRGALYSALLVLYALTSGIAGYIGCSYHKQMEGSESWVHTVLAVCFVYCGPLFLMFCFLNTVAIVYGVRSTNQLHLYSQQFYRIFSIYCKEIS